MLLGVPRLQLSLPRVHILLHLADEQGHRMEVEVAADVRVREPRPSEECRRVERPHATTTARACEHAARPRRRRPPTRVQSTRRAGAPRARGPRPPRRRRRHLRAERTAEAARAADDALLAVAHVARLRADMPAELAEPALEEASRRDGPLCSSFTSSRRHIASTPCSSASTSRPYPRHSSRTSAGGRRHVVQLIVAPPPSVAPISKSIDFGHLLVAAPAALR